MPSGPLSLTHFRDRLGHLDAWPQLALLGLVCGFFTSLIILVFRFVITWISEQFLPYNNAENFEYLEPIWRFLLPIAGSILIAILLSSVNFERSRLGIPHILERLSYHQGKLPLANAIVQFIGAALAIISGHSAGREGPAVHMGATGGSLLGQWLRLPNNSIRMLVGCGTAAAISASFNTPIAGVIFAMEVVMMEYTLIGFIPVTIASATAALVMQIALGNQIAFMVPHLELINLSEIPYVVFTGIVIGLLAFTFNKTVLTTIKTIRIPLAARLILAGVITGAIAVAYPEIMGLGYDSVTEMLYGDYGLHLLLGLTIAKLAATAIAVGLGVPMGLIGPSLFIGAAAGGALGLLGNLFANIPISDLGFYAVVGMGAMMGAVLQAPLAAIMAILELTNNSNFIFPAMAAVMSATLTCRYFFPHGSVFQAMLNAKGLDWRRAPMDQILERASVSSLMQKDVCIQTRQLSLSEAQLIAHDQHNWLLVTEDDQPQALLDNADLSSYLELQRLSIQPQQHDHKIVKPTINLMEIPALRRDIAPINYHATLKEANLALKEKDVEALYVVDNQDRILGILLRDDIVRFCTQRHEL